ncbi:MAG: RHS repeat-associated core domain-containing protein [Verrucomicrobiota bacterium]
MPTRQWDSVADMYFQADALGRLLGLETRRGGASIPTDFDRSDAGYVTDKDYTTGDGVDIGRSENGQINTLENEEGVVTTLVRPVGDLDATQVDVGTTQGYISTPGRSPQSRPTDTLFEGRNRVERSYTVDGRVATETQNNAFEIVNTFQSKQHERATRQMTLGADVETVTYTQDGFSRVDSISVPTFRVEYDYMADSSLVEGMRFFVNGTQSLYRLNLWDPERRRLDRIEYGETSTGTNTIAVYNYDYISGDDDRIEAIHLPDGGYWAYTYARHFGGGPRNLVAAECYLAEENGVRPGADFSYEYDEIGNLLEIDQGDVNNLPDHNFLVDDLNLQVERLWDNRALAYGTVTSEVTAVTVNGQSVPVDPETGWFETVIEVDNASSAAEVPITISAVRSGEAHTRDLVASRNGRLYVGHADEQAAYAGTGTPTHDSRYDHLFDARNRLREVATTDLATNIRNVYDYYPDHRLAEIKVYEGQSNAWTWARTHRLYWADWNLSRELITESGGGSVTKTYYWGLDIFGQRTGKTRNLQAAGGIGGLLAIRVDDGSTDKYYLPIQDHQGNILKLLDGDTGAIVAEYAYSPFGQLIGETGPARDICSLRFNSKYYDHVMELSYYGFRFYQPTRGKWLGREPLGEFASPNLLAFCRNDPVNRIDFLGLEDTPLNESQKYALSSSGDYHMHLAAQEGTVEAVQRLHRRRLEGVVAQAALTVLPSVAVGGGAGGGPAAVAGTIRAGRNARHVSRAFRSGLNSGVESLKPAFNHAVYRTAQGLEMAMGEFAPGYALALAGAGSTASRNLDEILSETAQFSKKNSDEFLQFFTEQNATDDAIKEVVAKLDGEVAFRLINEIDVSNIKAGMGIVREGRKGNLAFAETIGNNARDTRFIPATESLDVVKSREI